MAFTESDRVQIRNFLGFSAIFLQSDPRLENAIVAVQSVADGGTRPDNTTEVFIKGIVTILQAIDVKLLALHDQMQVMKADEVDLDVPRAVAVLKQEGRRQVTRLSAALATHPRRDIYSTSETADLDSWNRSEPGFWTA